ncbi:hypothetical protein C8Q77DRAFT_166627 [Trametes polyzona]|nr:hypothetical protein C8Q77DRAFT_166627 [Trametes polyzona]
MVKTRRKAQLKAALKHDYILKLPVELLIMIFDYFIDEDKLWLASLVTLCKALVPAVEAALYHDVQLRTCKRTHIFCRSIIKRCHRAPYVRRLMINVRGGTTLRTIFKTALFKLRSLSSFEVMSEDQKLFEALLDPPFRVRSLTLGGECPDVSLEDILACQPHIERLELAYDTCRANHLRITRPDILSKLRVLEVATNTEVSMSLITYPYPVTELHIIGAKHDDIEYALRLFGDTLVNLHIIRLIDNRCNQACYWPTTVLRNARLPRLFSLRVADIHWAWMTPFEPNSELMAVPGLHEACPVIKTFIWRYEDFQFDDLSRRVADGATGSTTLMDKYARTVFAGFPTLARMCFQDPRTTTKRSKGRSKYRGDVYWRGEDGEIVGPRFDDIDLEEWRSP